VFIDSFSGDGLVVNQLPGKLWIIKTFKVQ